MAGRRTLDIMRAAHQQNKAAVNSRLTGMMGRGSGGIAAGVGKVAFSVPGGAMLFGGAAAVMSHDPTKNTFASHMSQEGLKVGADAAFETALFGTVGRLGAWGMGAALVGSVGMYMTGTNPGEVVGHYLNKAGQAYRKDMGMGPTPITQNKRTMRATQRGLNLLSQSRGPGVQGHGMLGSEAMYMHN